MTRKLFNVLLIWCQMSACLAATNRVVTSSGTSTSGSIYAGITNFLGLTDTPSTYAGSNGKYLTVDANGVVFTELINNGTVTSVGISVDNGLAVSGSPVTTNGTIALTIDQSTLQAAIDTDTQLSQEQVEDYVGGLITNGSNITTSYDDTNGTLTISATGGSGTVTSVNNGDAFSEVATGTSTPVITINNGLIFNGAIFNTNFSASASTSLTDTADIIYETELDTEAELEAQLTDVTNVFTNNDGALADDDLSDNDTDDLSEGATNLYYTGTRANGAIASAVGVTVQAYDTDLDNWAVNNGSEIQATGSGGFTIKSSDGSDNLHLGNGGSPNATAYGGWNFNGATANTIASFGATKTLTSLSTATYPSLTELSYVKGVTSAIQTQLGNKQPLVDNLTTLSTNNGAELTNIDSTDITKSFAIALVESDTAVATGDGTIAALIPSDMAGMNIVDVIAGVHDQGVTGTTDIQVRRRRAGSDVDVLSTKVTIGAEYTASDGVINASNDDLAAGDMIYIDVDAVHSGTAPNGLTVTIECQNP